MEVGSVALYHEFLILVISHTHSQGEWKLDRLLSIMSFLTLSILYTHSQGDVCVDGLIRYISVNLELWDQKVFGCGIIKSEIDSFACPGKFAYIHMQIYLCMLEPVYHNVANACGNNNSTSNCIYERKKSFHAWTKLYVY
jgi:hypothetical protein